jgi:hypothetical protein
MQALRSSSASRSAGLDSTSGYKTAVAAVAVAVAAVAAVAAAREEEEEEDSSSHRAISNKRRRVARRGRVREATRGYRVTSFGFPGSERAAAFLWTRSTSARVLRESISRSPREYLRKSQCLLFTMAKALRHEDASVQRRVCGGGAGVGGHVGPPNRDLGTRTLGAFG